MCILWIQTQVLMLVKWAVGQLSHPPSPIFVFYGESYAMWWEFCFKSQRAKEHTCGGYGIFYLWSLRCYWDHIFLFFLVYCVVSFLLLSLQFTFSFKRMLSHVYFQSSAYPQIQVPPKNGRKLGDGVFFLSSSSFFYKGLPHLKLLPYFHWSVICFHGNRIRRWFLMIIFKAGSWLPLQLP